MTAEHPLQTFAEAQAFVDAHAEARQVNRILHGFPSPRFWRPGTISVPGVMQDRRESSGAAPPMELYVGVPFCIRTDPDRCGYCLFPVEVFSGAGEMEAQEVVDAVASEEVGEPVYVDATPEPIRPPL